MIYLEMIRFSYSNKCFQICFVYKVIGGDPFKCLFGFLK